MAKRTLDILTRSGFQPRKPLVAKSRDKLFGRLDAIAPAELVSFYESCNGGTLPRLQCRIYPLSEAIELVSAYDVIEAFRFLPFFVAENKESDPCMLVMTGPLRGFLYHHPHDFACRVMAPSISSFARALVECDVDHFSLEDATLVYPKELSTRESNVFKKLVTLIESDEVSSDSASLFRELALSMPLTQERSAAVASLGKAEDVFIQRCIRVLHAAGIQAQADKVYGMRVGPNNNAVNVRAFKSESKRPNFDEYLVERIRYLFFD